MSTPEKNVFDLFGKGAVTKTQDTVDRYNGRRGSVQHIGGQHFDINNPDVNHLSLNDIGRVLSKVCRFGGHTTDFYSVAQHSVLVAALSPKDRNSQKWALLHDGNEALSIPDIPSPIKPFAGELVGYQKIFERLIADRFELEGHEPAAVKFADLEALSLERAYCMSPSYEPDEWGQLPDAPNGIEIEALGPREASRLFADAVVRVFEMETAIDLPWLSRQAGFRVSPELTQAAPNNDRPIGP